MSSIFQAKFLYSEQEFLSPQTRNAQIFTDNFLSVAICVYLWTLFSWNITVRMITLQ